MMRLGVGGIIFYYGCQKLLGLFGGNGFGATMEFFQSQMGIPAIFAFLAIVAEFFGALGVMVGFLHRIAAFGLLATMAVAFMVNLNRVGGLGVLAAGEISVVNQIFYPLALGMGAFGLMLTGAGKLSLDHAWGIDRKLFKTKATESAD